MYTVPQVHQGLIDSLVCLELPTLYMHVHKQIMYTYMYMYMYDTFKLGWRPLHLFMSVLKAAELYLFLL